MATPNDTTLNSRLSIVENVLSKNVDKTAGIFVSMKPGSSAADIQNVVNSLTYGTVYVPGGTYQETTTLIVKQDVKVLLDPGAIITSTNDINIVQLKRGGRIEGGTLQATNLSFSKAALYLDGADHFFSDFTSFSDISLLGPNSGDGINFTVSGGTNDYICFVQAHNIYISGFNKGLHLYANAAYTNWITGNLFSHVVFDYCVYPLYVDGGAFTPSQIAGNTFHDIQIQTESMTINSIFMSGWLNNVDGFVWDVTNTTSTVSIVLDSRSNQNTINTNLGFEGGWIQDSGRYNNISSFTRNAVNGVALPPSAQYSQQMVGDQDDYLAFADKRFTVTQTSGPAITSGSLANMFNLNGGDFCRWNGVTSGSPVVLLIDMTASPMSYMTYVGLLSVYDEFPKNLQIEYSVDGTTWQTALNRVGTNNHQIVCWGWRVTGTLKMLRITFSQSANANGNISFTRIFAQSSGGQGMAWLPRNGGTMYGDLDLNKYKMKNMVIDQGATASRPTSPTTGQMWYDTTLGKPIWYNGTAWKDAAGTTV